MSATFPIADHVKCPPGSHINYAADGAVIMLCSQDKSRSYYPRCNEADCPRITFNGTDRCSQHQPGD